VLITNGRHSFAIFYYGKIEWTTGDASKSIYGGIPAQVVLRDFSSGGHFAKYWEGGVSLQTYYRPLVAANSRHHYF
jgi:hypothetical protein